MTDEPNLGGLFDLGVTSDQDLDATAERIVNLALKFVADGAPPLSRDRLLNLVIGKLTEDAIKKTPHCPCQLIGSFTSYITAKASEHRWNCDATSTLHITSHGDRGPIY